MFGVTALQTTGRRLLAGVVTGAIVSSLAVVALPSSASAATAGPTISVISGEIEQLTLDTPTNTWSGGWIRVGGQDVVLPKNLLLDLPANRMSLQQLFSSAPKACKDRQESGLGKADVCNTSGSGGFATIQANRTNAGDVIAGDVFIEKGREILTGTVTSVNFDAGSFAINEIAGVAGSGVTVRLNDPTGRHTTQQGPGCAATSTPNCSPDRRFALDPDNYTNAFSTGYPMCIPSTVARTFTDRLDFNGNGDATEQLVAQASSSGTGDELCPDGNRNADNVAADSRRLAPLLVGDNVTVHGNYENVGGVRFLSAYSTKIGTALETNGGPGQPDYMVLDQMFIDAPAFQRLRIRDQFIGATTEVDSDVELWSVHRDPATNKAHEFPLGSVLGCENIGPLNCRRVLGPHTFRVRHDTLLTAGAAKNPKLSACDQLKADPRFALLNLCPQGGTVDEEFGILSPLPHEVQARTGRKTDDLATGGGGTLKTMDLSGNDATNGQFLFPMGIGLGGIEVPNFAEIDINKLNSPISFDGIPWNLDRRLSPNGCDGACEAAPQPLDPFPFPGLDPRTQGGIPALGYSDPGYTATPLTRLADRVLSYVDPTVNNFNGDATLLAWPPTDPGPVGPPPPPPNGGGKGLITDLTPATGPEGTTVVIDGIHFTGASAVTFGGVAATNVSVLSDLQISATVPAGAGSGLVTVTTPGGVLTSAVRFTVVALPTVTRISPAIGLGGTPITITGSGFTTATDVSVGTSLTAFTVLSDTSIRTVVPTDAISGPVHVTNVAGTADGPVFSVTAPPPAPVLTGIAPDNGPSGTSVTITGRNLDTASAVYFGGVPSPSVTATATSVSVIVPDGAPLGQVPVKVAAAGGADTGATFFLVTKPTPPPAPPVITGFSPTTGPVGTQVTLTGTNFAGAVSVSFGTMPAAFQVLVDGSILTAVPAGAVSGLILVSTALGGPGDSAPQTFTVTAAPPPDPTPTVTSFTPISGLAGTTAVITGTNLTGSSAVTVNGTPAQSFTVDSATQITFVVGAGSRTGPIRVQAPGGIATSATTFKVPLPPAITSFTPTAGAGGTTAVITGLRFTGATAVTVNGTPASSYVVNSATKITFVVGTGTTTGVLSVTTAAGTGSSTAKFVVPPPPTITSFTPAKGNSGTTVVITGTNFTGATAVGIGVTNARSFVVNTARKITFVVGTGTVAGLVQVKTAGGTVNSVSRFTIVGPPK